MAVFRFLERKSSHLCTAKKAGNWRVLSSDMFVNMNSNRAFWWTVSRYKACAVPRSLDSTVFMLIARMHDRPTAVTGGIDC